MTITPIPTLTSIPVLVRSSETMTPHGAGVLFNRDTEITGLHVVTKHEALTRVKNEEKTKQYQLCLGLSMLQSALKHGKWSDVKAALDIKAVRNHIPHFHGDMELDDIRDGRKWKDVGWVYSGLMSNLLQSARFIMWVSGKDNRMRPGLFCPDWDVAVYAIVGMDLIRFCAKPSCGAPFVPHNLSPNPDNDQKYCSPAHANSDRKAKSIKAKRK